MTKPRILVDALGIDRPGGARTAIHELFLHVLAQRPDWHVTFVLSAPEPKLAAFPNASQIILPVRKGPAARLLAQAALPLIARREHADLVHFAKSQGSLTPGVKTVLTLFDATTLRLPEMHSPLAVWYWRHIQPFMARRADHVVTLSHHAADELVALLAIDAGHITVVPCASRFSEQDRPDATRVAAVRARHKLPARSLLSVGILARKKNLDTVVRAMARLRDFGIPIALVLAGPPYRESDGSSVLDLITTLGLEQQVHYLGPVPDTDLPALFAGAEAYLAPSLHEGFGIPILEAMALGAPVIAAAAAAQLEVAGDAGLLVADMRSPDAWAEAIAALVGDPARRNDLIERGTLRARAYTWSAAAATLIGVYERVLGIPARQAVSR